jgi:hypothetical protein
MDLRTVYVYIWIEESHDRTYEGERKVEEGILEEIKINF